jgi:hypothetical protein
MFAEAPFPVQVVVFLVILAVFSPLIYFVFWLGLESWPGSDLAGRRPGDRDPIWVDPDPAHPRGWHTITALMARATPGTGTPASGR